MAKRVWYELEIYDTITDKWEVVIRAKSKGLANMAYGMLVKLYGEQHVRSKGWHN